MYVNVVKCIFDIAAMDHHGLFAAKNGGISSMSYLHKMGMTNNAFFWSACTSQVESAKYLISVGADVSTRNFLSLYTASFNGDVEIVRVILDQTRPENGVLNACILMTDNDAVLEMLRR